MTMTREEAHTLLEIMAINLTGAIASSEDPITEQTKLMAKQIEAIDLAIEALSEPDSIDLKKAYSLVFQDLQKCSLFTGLYDAKNGSSIFMNGISTVMESIAYGVSEEVGDAFTDLFIKNMVKCEEEASAEAHDKRTETHGVCSISKDDAMGAVQDHFNADGFKGYDDGQKMMDRIKALPSAEAVQGEWIRKYDDKINCYWYECDQCGEYRPRNQFGHEYNANFCPNCGARMRGEEE